MSDAGQIVAELMHELDQLRLEVAHLKEAAAERQRAEAELRRATAEMEAVFRALPDLKLRLDGDGVVLSYQAGAVAQPQQPAEMLTGRRIQEVMPDEVGNQYAAAIRHVTETRSRMRFEYALSDRDQSVHYEARLLPLEEGEVLAVVRDITARRHQETIRAARLRVHAAVLRMGSAEDIVEVLEVISGSLGRLDVPFADCAINLVDDPPRVTLYSLRAGGETELTPAGGVMVESPLICEFWRRGAVEYRPDLHTADPFDERGHMPAELRAVVDIPFSHGTLAFNSPQPNAFTEQHIRQMQEVAGMLSEGFQRVQDLQQIAAERERLIVTLRSIRSGVIATDRDGRVVLVNPVSEALTGWMQAEAAGQPLSAVLNLIDEETRVAANVRLDEVSTEEVCGDGAEAQARLALLVSRAEEERGIAYTAAPIRADEGGATLGVVVVFRDLTEERRTEAERLRTQKLESVGLLAGGIAHDFNNILVGIMGNVSIARAGGSCGEQLEEILADVERSTQEARSLTQQLLTFSRGGAPVKETASVSELIRDSAQFVLRGSSSRCEFELEGGLWTVEVDKGQVSQVVHNLVLNSVQAMPQGGVVRISTRNLTIGSEGLSVEPGDYIVVAVADDGVGIPKDHLQTIFDPYFTTKQEGSGLGLATSYSIVKNHGGLLTAYSELGKGSIFRMYLPALPHAASEEEHTPAEIVTGAGRVLVMDDDDLVQGLAVRMLERLGYQAEVARNGEEALALYQASLEASDGYLAVVMDLTVTDGMGGSETIKQLLTLDPGARAIVSSGYSQDPIMSEYDRYGFVGVIAKPYNIQSLSQVLHDVITAESQRSQA